MENQINFSHAATIFPVKDIQRSIDFYTQQLKFDLTFTWEDPITYAVLKKGGVSIHLTKRADDLYPSKKHTALYIFVHNLQEVYEQCLKEQVPILNPLGARDYQMKDFDIQDPEGYIITFGKGE